MSKPQEIELHTAESKDMQERSYLWAKQEAVADLQRRLSECELHRDTLLIAAENASTVMLTNISPSDCTAHDWAMVVDAQIQLIKAIGVKP